MKGLATLCHLAVPFHTAPLLLVALFSALLLGGCATATPPDSIPRPGHWATPAEAAGIPNLYRVSGSLYRSARITPTRRGNRCSCTAGAIDEMTRGGYGFRPVWQNLVRYVEELNVEAIRAEAVTDR